jgi:ribosome recycling factor
MENTENQSVIMTAKRGRKKKYDNDDDRRKAYIKQIMEYNTRKRKQTREFRSHMSDTQKAIIKFLENNILSDDYSQRLYEELLSINQPLTD